MGKKLIEDPVIMVLNPEWKVKLLQQRSLLYSRWSVKAVNAFLDAFDYDGSITCGRLRAMLRRLGITGKYASNMIDSREHEVNNMFTPKDPL